MATCIRESSSRSSGRSRSCNCPTLPPLGVENCTDPSFPTFPTFITACRTGDLSQVMQAIDSISTSSAVLQMLFINQRVVVVRETSEQVPEATSTTTTTTTTPTTTTTTTTALHLAVAGGHSHIVSYLLSCRADVHARDSSRQTALLLAVSLGDLPCVTVLLREGAAVDVVDSQGCTALLLACYGFHEEVAIALITHKTAKASLNLPNHERRTPLIVASEMGQVSLVKALLKKKAAVDFADRTGRTALLEACHQGHIQIVQLLLDFHAQVGVEANDGTTPLDAACSSHHSSVITLLCQQFCQATPALLPYLQGSSVADYFQTREGQDMFVTVTSTTTTPPTAAARLPFLKFLLRQKACIDSRRQGSGTTALMEACNRGDSPLVVFLLTQGAGVNVVDFEGNTALAWALPYPALVKILLSKQADVNLPDREGVTVLMKAAEAGATTVVRCLLDKNALVTKADGETGRQAIHYASQADVLELLLQAYPNLTPALLDRCDRDGLTALQLAARAGQLDVVKVLVKYKASVTMPDKSRNKDSAIGYAVQRNHVEVVSFLLAAAKAEATAEATVARITGSALLHACKQGSVPMVELLLRYQADLTYQASTPDASTALTVATYHGHLPVVRLLLEAHADVLAGNGEALSVAMTGFGMSAVLTQVLQRAEDTARLQRTPTPAQLRQFGFADPADAICVICEDTFLLQQRLTQPCRSCPYWAHFDCVVKYTQTTQRRQKGGIQGDRYGRVRAIERVLQPACEHQLWMQQVSWKPLLPATTTTTI